MFNAKQYLREIEFVIQRSKWPVFPTEDRVFEWSYDMIWDTGFWVVTGKKNVSTF
jgi:hypothetical protein